LLLGPLAPTRANQRSRRQVWRSASETRAAQRPGQLGNHRAWQHRPADRQDPAPPPAGDPRPADPLGPPAPAAPADRLAVGRTVRGGPGLPAGAATTHLTGRQPPPTIQTASRPRVSLPDRPTKAPAPRLDASPHSAARVHTAICNARHVPRARSPFNRPLDAASTCAPGGSRLRQPDRRGAGRGGPDHAAHRASLAASTATVQRDRAGIDAQRARRIQRAPGGRGFCCLEREVGFEPATFAMMSRFPAVQRVIGVLSSQVRLAVPSTRSPLVLRIVPRGMTASMTAPAPWTVGGRAWRSSKPRTGTMTAGLAERLVG
jgi:hypothetical protein